MENNNVRTKVIDQQINGVPMEEYFANLLSKIENSEIEKEQCEMRISVLKQLNNRHKNVIDAQRVIIKQMEVIKE